MKKLFMLAVMCLFGAAAHAQDADLPFKVSPQHPTGGGEVTLTYDNSLTPLAGSKEITGVIYLCLGEEWTADDLDLTFADGVWTATYVVPEECVLFTCKFYGDGDEWDSGSAAASSYGMFVYNVDGEKISLKPRTYMNRGLMVSKSLAKFTIPDFLREEQREDTPSTYSWFMGEGVNFPQSGEDLVYYSYMVRNEYEPGKHDESLINDIDVMLSHEGIKEISLIRAAEMSRSILKDEEKAKHIEAVTLERFPNGLLARDAAVRKVFTESDKELKFRYLEEFVDRFPPRNFPKPQTRADEVYYYRMYWQALRDLPEKVYNLDVLAKYLPLMPFTDIAETYYRGIFLPHDKGLKTSAELRPYADAVYAELIRRINGPEDLFYSGLHHTRYSPRQWRNKMLYNEGKLILQHAKILMETGSPEQALEILEPLREVLGGKISQYNEVYVKLLEINGYDHLVVPFIEESIRVDAATPEMLATLRAAFVCKNPKGDFDAYVNGLRSAEHVAHLEAKLTSELVKEQVGTFKLDAMNGAPIDLAELKGQVVVIDFWATWCSPCMAAMPGMKMARDRYKDNKDVIFLFIDTMERGGDPKEYVPQVMEMKGYSDFNVLYDVKGEAYGTFSKKFSMSGIPQKIILDQDGYVRWVSGGYFGNPLELANEVSFIVDYLLKEKK